ncbi:dicarboxylate/amino acid:cation symporter [Clostridium taeniosporum]|uniref:Dicarboxylate/amino acid:cation symporter n=1 Tax=Clostridium taeniosporum TaxID=394958 RepID=A0A1D7XJQ9_9CLOT|nr:dicarboxylate/amino acid:cation symporter [Clostridium taeniosporum]AOR23430.1 dicarboxylate/amino acid:cation symporter [Clostridium taeniosporum]
MRFIKNYKYSIILLLSIILGGLIGLIMGQDAKIFEPLGKLFLNLIFTSLIPIVFFSISSSIANIESSKKLGKLLGITVIVFGTTAIISGILGVASFKLFNPTKGLNLSTFDNLINSNQKEMTNSFGILEKIVNSISVGDFSELLTRSNLLALIMFSIIVGFATMLCKEEGKMFAKFLNSGAAVTMKIVSIIMYYAPIGLGAYFASIIGELGGQILTGYFKVFILYTILSILYFGVFFTIYAYIAGGKKGIKCFWKNSVEPSVTAVATCSSAACIPVNIKAAKRMGVPDNIAKILMPIGVNIHKDGSVIGGVYKIMFLFGIFGRDIDSISSLVIILVLGLVIGAVVGAVPGGGAIGEMLILSIFNFPQEALAIMLVIATIIDMPATLLNSSGNTVCTMMISRFMGNKQNHI